MYKSLNMFCVTSERLRKVLFIQYNILQLAASSNGWKASKLAFTDKPWLII